MVTFWLLCILVGAGSYDPSPFMFLSFLPVVGLFCIMPSFIAHKKGRRRWLWLVYGIAFGLAALPHSILIPHLDSLASLSPAVDRHSPEDSNIE